VHVPDAMNGAVVPETVLMPLVSEVKVTSKPDLTVAESVSGVPIACEGDAPKVIACDYSLTIKLCEAVGAAE
jgi:hypothetical protein